MTQATQTKFSLRRGDEVVVTAGKDKGKTGRIKQVLRDRSRVVVEGANMVKRHVKAGLNQEPGIVSKEMPLHISNVMLADPRDGKPTRVGHKFLDDGRKVRYAKRSGEVIENAKDK